MPNWVLVIVFICLWLPRLLVAAEHAITVYAGKYTDNALEEILTGQTIDYENSNIMAIAPAVVLFEPKADYQWELEGQLVKHIVGQTHWEFNFLAIARWKSFPWNRHLRTTAAIGDGLSYATVVPPLELASHTNVGATRLLNYLLIEISVAPPQAKKWSMIGRIHHRSGIFGIFDNVKGGSNILSMGVKFLY